MTGLRLVTFTAVAPCDRGGHEVTIVTDGHYAYAWGHTTDAGAVSRDGVALTAPCGQPSGPREQGLDADPCEGTVTWALDTPGCWVTDPQVIDTLTNYGQPVEA